MMPASRASPTPARADARGPLPLRPLACVVGLVLIGSMLLHLRRQELEAWHRIGLLHVDIDAQRRATWDLQERVHAETRPQVLNQRLQGVRGPFEPVARGGGSAVVVQP